jgi:hypothetical protein
MATELKPGVLSPAQQLLFLGSLVVSIALVVACAILVFMLRNAVAERDAEFARTDALEAKTAEATIRASRLDAKLAATQVRLQLLSDQVSQLKSDVNAKEQALAEAQTRAETAQIALQREKSPLVPVPVSITFNRSSGGKMLAGVFTNVSPKDITVVVQVSTSTNGKQERFTLQLPAGERKEIGPRDGWQFASGDTISMLSSGFLTSNLKVR